MKINHIFSIVLIGASLSFSNVYANEGHDHKESATHAKSEMPIANDMSAMMAEMEAIINTDDAMQRKALFATHKEKMQAMMDTMHTNCDMKSSEHTHDKSQADKHSH